jgi:hypothetical protein
MGIVYKVQLLAPATLRQVLESYLTLGVCPVRASPLPKPMAQVEIEIVFPGGRSQLYRGVVIRHMSSSQCLVQISTGLDLASIRAALDEAERAVKAGAASGERGGEDGAGEGGVGGGGGGVASGERGGETGAREGGEGGVGGGGGGVASGERGGETGAGEGGEGGERAPEAVDAYKLLQTANVAEKQKLARSGNQMLRNLLIRDRIKNVHVFVLMNPRITSEEVAEYSKLAGLSKDAIQMIAGNRVWSSSPQVVMNLVRNPATPPDLLPNLLRRLSQNQLRMLAKSSDVRSQVSTLARRMLFG